MNYADYPVLPNAENRPVRQITADEIPNVGANSGAFSIHKGDILEFKEETPMMCAQEVSDTPSPTTGKKPEAYYVACLRKRAGQAEGKPSWVGIGIFTRRDIDGKPVGEFQERASVYANFQDLYDAELKGKTLTCTGMIKKKFPRFQDGKRLKNEDGTWASREADVPTFTIA